MSEKFLKWMFRNFFVGTESNGEGHVYLVNEKALRGTMEKNFDRKKGFPDLNYHL